MRRLIIILLALALSSSQALSRPPGRWGFGDANHLPGYQPPVAVYFGDWRIGPIINGKNYSEGMPLYPTTNADGGWTFNFPGYPGGVDYVTLNNPPSLIGARAISVNFEITGGGFAPTEHPDAQATFSIAFQRRGDNWTGQGAYASYRWYCHPSQDVRAGAGVLIVPIVLSSCTNVWGQNTDQAGFNAAIANLGNISITFGGGGSAGHGVYATAPATFRMVKFEVLR